MKGYENFTNASEEKQNAVINAGYSCFGENGYKKTSMNDIAKRANVSKASLFYYFNDKESFYKYLFNNACQTIISNFIQGSDDFYDSMIKAVNQKLDILKNYPALYDFFTQAIEDQDTPFIKNLLEESIGNVALIQSDYFSKIDWSRLKISPEKATNLVRYISTGITNDYSRKKSIDEIKNEYISYLEIIKRAIYKEEYL